MGCQRPLKMLKTLSANIAVVDENWTRAGVHKRPPTLAFLMLLLLAGVLIVQNIRTPTLRQC